MAHGGGVITFVAEAASIHIAPVLFSTGTIVTGIGF